MLHHEDLQLSGVYTEEKGSNNTSLRYTERQRKVSRWVRADHDMLSALTHVGPEPAKRSSWDAKMCLYGIQEDGGIDRVECCR